MLSSGFLDKKGHGGHLREICGDQCLDTTVHANDSKNAEAFAGTVGIEMFRSFVRSFGREGGREGGKGGREASRFGMFWEVVSLAGQTGRHV